MRAPIACFCALLAVATQGAAAFERCDRWTADPAGLARELSDKAVARAPARHHDLARQIRVVTTTTAAAADSLMPFAGDQLGTRYVVVTPLFARLACRIGLAEYMRNEGVLPDAFDAPVRAAGTCLDRGGAQKTCLPALADELARRYARPFAALPAGRQQVAMNIVHSTLNQVVMHEYAHHFMNHAARLAARQIDRIDAEFEADLFAVTNGAQAGETASALDYLFNPLADVERSTAKPTTPQYESASCRTGNIEAIVATVGLMPLLLANSAAGGGVYLTSVTTAAATRSLAEESFALAAPGPVPGTCARIAKVALGDARLELLRLYRRLEKDFDWLFADPARLDVAKANRLLHDLSDMANDFTVMRGTAAKSAAMLLRQWGLKGRPLRPLNDELQRLIDAEVAHGELLSEDVGRLLGAQGVALLQERADLAPVARLKLGGEQLQRAVDYNPALGEAWANLGFIAFKRGDCAAAVQAGERAALLAPDPKFAAGLQDFADKMRRFAADPPTCRREGEQFHPYPGL